MGMTIDEHIAQLKKLKSFHNGSYGASINFAIDTMRKYQTMQEVLEKVWNTPSFVLDESECLNEIMETYRTVR